jgi:hypothetical protein
MTQGSRTSIVLRTFCHALKWYTIRVCFVIFTSLCIWTWVFLIFNSTCQCNIFLTYLKISQFMCQNWQDYYYFCVSFNPLALWHKGKGYLKGTSYKVLTIWLLKHSLLPLFTNHIVLPFWLWFFSSVHPFMTSSTTHCLTWELYRSSQTCKL